MITNAFSFLTILCVSWIGVRTAAKSKFPIFAAILAAVLFYVSIWPENYINSGSSYEQGSVLGNFLGWFGLGKSDAKGFFDTHEFWGFFLLVIFEEAAKLIGIVILAARSGQFLTFYDRCWLAFSFGFAEYLRKILDLATHSLLFLEFAALASLTICMHALPAFYPKSLLGWRAVIVFLVLCFYHTTFNYGLELLGAIHVDSFFDFFKFLAWSSPPMILIGSRLAWLRSKAKFGQH